VWFNEKSKRKMDEKKKKGNKELMLEYSLIIEAFLTYFQQISCYSFLFYL